MDSLRQLHVPSTSTRAPSDAEIGSYRWMEPTRRREAPALGERLGMELLNRPPGDYWRCDG